MGHNDTKNIGKIHQKALSTLSIIMWIQCCNDIKKILGIFPTGKFNIHDVRQMVEYLGV